jgi:NAD(P)-dependent dehydrogenase (short-subunit alcohol dehydrogenase family)
VRCIFQSRALTVASGIGKAISVGFAREGCQKITIADLSTSALEETAKEITSAFPGVEVLSVAVNVAKPDDVKRMLDETIGKFGRVDYAVNAAGIMGPVSRSHEMSVEDFDKINDVDYKGCWLSSREELKHMISQEPLPTHDGRPGNRG